MQTQQKIIFLVIALLAIRVAMQRYNIQLKTGHIAIGSVLIAATLQSSHTMESSWTDYFLGSDGLLTLSLIHI